MILALQARAQRPQCVSAELHFPTATFDLSNEHMAQLDALFPLPDGLIVDNILITARADQRGDAAKNKVLSEQRATEVYNYLKSQHLDVLTYAVSALGESQPLQNRPLDDNRMVEVKILLAKPWAEPSEESVLSLFEEDFPKEQNQEINYKEDEKWNAEVDAVVTLDNVEFEPSSTAYSSKSRRALKELLEFLEDNPTARIRIDGHTNIGQTGALRNNVSREVRKKFGSLEGLALERAKAIRRYLTEKGIAASRIEVKGWGAKKPIYPKPKSVSENSANRRIEVVVLNA